VTEFLDMKKRGEEQFLPGKGRTDDGKGARQPVVVHYLEKEEKESFIGCRKAGWGKIGNGESKSIQVSK